MTFQDRKRLAAKLGLTLVIEVGKLPEYRHDDQPKPQVPRYARTFYPPEPPRLTPREMI